MTSPSTIDNFPSSTDRTICLSARSRLMHGMKIIGHLGSFEVRYDNWMHPAGLLASRRPARAWLQAPRCERVHVSHSLDETAFGRSFCLCWPVHLRDATGRWSASYERRSTRLCQ